MPTRSKKLTLISLNVPVDLAKILISEAKATGTSLANLARHAVKWHDGRALARHPGSPPLSLPVRSSKTKVNKSMLLDLEDVAHLDKVGGRIGLTRTATLLLVLVQYLDLDPVAPTRTSNEPDAPMLQ